MTEHDYSGDPDGGEDCSSDCVRCAAIREIEWRYEGGWPEILEHVLDLEDELIPLKLASHSLLTPVDWEALGRELRGHLQHAVGSGERNHFCIEVGSVVAGHWELLIGMGLAQRGPLINDGRDRYYYVIDPAPWVEE